jgi:tetratricopeptide (TPR) repeat protein
MALGSFADARTDFDRALELNPASAQGYLNRGILHVGHLANYDAGIADFRRVQELEPTNTDAALNLGMALYKKREYQAAVDQYSSLLNILPDNARLYYLRALAYGEMRDFTNALKDGTRAKGLGLAIDDALLAKSQARPDYK